MPRWCLLITYFSILVPAFGGKYGKCHLLKNYERLTKILKTAGICGEGKNIHLKFDLNPNPGTAQMALDCLKGTPNNNFVALSVAGVQKSRVFPLMREMYKSILENDPSLCEGELGCALCKFPNESTTGLCFIGAWTSSSVVDAGWNSKRICPEEPEK